MKNTLIVTILLILAGTVNAQGRHCNCSNDSLSSEDPITQKIQAFNPTIFFLKDTISSLYDFELKKSFLHNEVGTIWVIVVNPKGKEVELNCESDFSFNCQTNEFEILNCNLIRKESIIEIYWTERR